MSIYLTGSEATNAFYMPTTKNYGEWLMNHRKKALKGWQKELKRNRKHKH